MDESPYVNTPYPQGVAINREILSDIDHSLPDEEIIIKLQSTGDLMTALWGDMNDAHTLRYIPLHHAASRGRQLLVDFILSNATYSPALVNIMNDNYFTALRYANRGSFSHIISMLESAGATEEFPNIAITCPCGSEFTYTSDKQARFNAQNFQAPRHCGNCRAARKAQQQGGGGNNNNGGYQHRNNGGGYGDRNNGGGGGGYRNNNYNNNNGYNNNRGGGNGGGFGGRNNGGGGYQSRDSNGFQSRDNGHYNNNNNNGGGFGGHRGGGGGGFDNYQQHQSRPQYQQQRNYGGNDGGRSGNGYYGGYNRDDIEH